MRDLNIYQFCYDEETIHDKCIDFLVKEKKYPLNIVQEFSFDKMQRVEALCAMYVFNCEVSWEYRKKEWVDCYKYYSWGEKEKSKCEIVKWDKGNSMVSISAFCLLKETNTLLDKSFPLYFSRDFVFKDIPVIGKMTPMDYTKVNPHQFSHKAIREKAVRHITSDYPGYNMLESIDYSYPKIVNVIYHTLPFTYKDKKSFIKVDPFTGVCEGVSMPSVLTTKLFNIFK